jgi:hypothetical protein
MNNEIIKLIRAYYTVLENEKYSLEKLNIFSIEQLMVELTRVRQESSKKGM